MEQLRERLASTGRALDTLDESLGMPFSVIVRDASLNTRLPRSGPGVR